MAKVKFLIVLAVLFPLTVQGQAKPATQPQKMVTGGDELLAALPDNLKPSKDGAWDEVKTAEVRKWLRDNYAGRHTEVATVIERLSRERIPAKNDPIATAGWRLVLIVRPVPVKSAAVIQVRTQDASLPGSVRPIVDSKTAEAAEKWEEGDNLTVRGMIVEILTDGPTVQDRKPFPTFTIVLTDTSVAHKGGKLRLD